MVATSFSIGISSFLLPTNFLNVVSSSVAAPLNRRPERLSWINSGGWAKKCPVKRVGGEGTHPPRGAACADAWVAHVLRHSCAMVVLRATQDIRKVALWLGHSNTQTTEVYTRADPSEKLEAVNALTPPGLRPGKFRPPDKLIALLKGRVLCGAKQPSYAQQNARQAGELPITSRSP